MDYDAISLALQATSIQVTKSSQLLSLTSHMTYHSWGSLAWAESVTKVEEKVTKAIKAALAGDKYDRPVLDAFNAVFEQSTLTPLKLKRFGSLKALLLTDLLPKRMAEAKKAAAPVIYDMLQKALMQLNYDCALGATFQLLDVGIRGCIIKHVIAHIRHHPLSLPESFQLAEDDKVKKKRSRLTDKLTQIVTAQTRSPTLKRRSASTLTQTSGLPLPLSRRSQTSLSWPRSLTKRWWMTHQPQRQLPQQLHP